MATQNIYISIGGPPPELPDIGPGSSGGAGSANVGSVLGQTYAVNTYTLPSASLELRFAVNTGAENVDTELGSQNVWTTQDLWQALDKLKFLIRQRGFIGGSGGPVVNSTFSDTSKTATTTLNSATLTVLSANVNTAGWHPGMAISGTGIPASTTILGVSSDGLQVFMSANATANGALIALTVTSAAAQLPI